MKNQIGIMQGRIFPDISGVLQKFPRQFWKEEFAEASQIGFSYIELLYDKDEAYENPLTRKNRIKEIKKYVSSGEISLYSICVDYFTKKNLLNSEDNDSWEKFKQLINFAEELSISVIVVPFFDKNHLKNKIDLQRFLALVERKIFSELDTNVCLCIETTLEAKQILSALNRTSTPIKICYDLGNAVSQNFNPDNEIELIADYIGLVHIKDRKKNGGPNVIMGEGNVDFVSAFKALREIDYKGNFTLETAVGDNPLNFANKHLKKVQDLI